VALKLPSTVAGKREILQLQREVELLSNDHLQSRVAAREANKIRKIAEPSPRLVELLRVNGIKPDDASLRALSKELADLRATAPNIRINLSAEPTDEISNKLIIWFRKNVDTRILVTIGVSPSISGGFVLETEKKRYDFSFRTRLLNSISKFSEVLHRGK